MQFNSRLAILDGNRYPQLMIDDLYIAIGTRGTSLTKLRDLPRPLVSGVNTLPRPLGVENPLYLDSHAWVTNSREGDSFTLMRLRDAIARGMVVRVSGVRWRLRSTGAVHIGDAFFPAGWKPGNAIPTYVAVSSPSWKVTTLETQPNAKNRAVYGEIDFTSVTPPAALEAKQPSAARRLWTRDELLIALNLYHKIPFSHFDAKKPVIAEVARQLGRTPGSLAMKLGNLASLDPVLKMRGIGGLAGASDLDREMWNEFHSTPVISAAASEDAFRELFGVPEGAEVELLKEEGVRVRQPPAGATEFVGSAKFRRGQEYFREVVLNNFDRRCGLTQIGVSALLIASHILPWKGYEKERLDVRNGICLSRLHDAAFDRGLITFGDDLRLKLSPRLKAHFPQKALEDNFARYEGEPLRMPADAEPPSAEYLAVHRQTIFVAS